MAFPRESSFMPTIKCSSCGNEVEISMMGEHICGASLDSEIATDYDATPPLTARRPGGYGGFEEPDARDGEPNYQSSSPKRQQGALLQRMNTIAPGPFEMNRKPGPASKNAFASLRKNSTTDEMPPVSPRITESPKLGYSTERTSPVAQSTSAPKDGFAFLGNNHVGIAPPRVPRKNGYGGFGPPGQSPEEFEPEPFGVNRSGTFPRPNNPAEAPLRTPSAPGPRPERLKQIVDEAPSHTRQPSMGPDTSRPPPPRTSLLSPSTAGNGSSTINLANEFGVGNPYHSPSDSASPERRKPSDTSNFDNIMIDLEVSMADMGSMQQNAPSNDRKANSSFNRQPSLGDVRYDPAAQGRPERTRSPLAAGPNDYNRAPVETHIRQQASSPPRDLLPQPSTRKPSDPAVQSSRGNCKSCGDPIKGKSISSADGRLTGRYHKACFVCTTCTEPFSSAEFYVHNDKPYCEQHYHKLNGSLCGSCGRGIEGQYLEDEESIKYHVGCFRCGDCGMSLSNGYFEVDGRAFCERDAWKRVQQPDGPPRGMARSPGPQGPPGARRGGPPPMGPGMGSKMGPPMGPGGPGRGGPRPAIGLPRGQRLAPGANLAPMPRMNKRMTRLGMM
ncbi:Endo-1,4-beta-xylanase C [Verticillium dahliae VDG1]|nr:Endo-1,4-beta-xylanase C [Verticillium dahliae VDG1]